ncbi:hypothetical protein LWI28_012837 [Acer negundo]|uniref:Uncharacterized protein n=1 Tax=Acer negundo TaxID=4023 RepID=A0AAD5NQ50_ACENE|nr:hypothetical protein LWI28_012837 [Acer negundo]
MDSIGSGLMCTVEFPSVETVCDNINLFESSLCSLNAIPRGEASRSSRNMNVTIRSHVPKVKMLSKIIRIMRWATIVKAATEKAFKCFLSSSELEARKNAGAATDVLEDCDSFEGGLVVVLGGLEGGRVDAESVGTTYAALDPYAGHRSYPF